MAGSLLLMCLPLLALSINNVYYFFVEPSIDYAWYLISDLLSLLVLVALWVYNRNGGTRWVGSVTVVLVSFGISFLYSPDNPSSGLLMYALPILIASFVIEPRASFWVYLISLVTYTISLAQTHLINSYDVTGMTALLVVAISTWIISERLENTIARNTALYNDLQLSNQELKDSYETTLEGWSHALDLRDKDTEGHTLRVTELTLQIARAMSFTPEQLIHVRRGALLHDIGKMGVPDTILHKPGPLTEEEWQIMRRHPELAVDLLTPIKHLAPALDIPRCHHEKWDGTGYPKKLKGEQIPLAARIFAVVDVYDALTSDRPYRIAWPKEQVLEYIRVHSGTHFDPAVVDVFLKELSS